LLQRVNSGGQTGVDQAALREARAVGIPTGGWAPMGWETEDGPAPWPADSGLAECPTPSYPARLKANILRSDATLLIGDGTTPGSKRTVSACAHHYKTWAVAIPGATTPRMVADWVHARHIRVLHVAGSRESKSPGIGARAEAFLAVVFRLCQEGGSGG
jgi:hypothetical protein